MLRRATAERARERRRDCRDVVDELGRVGDPIAGQAAEAEDSTLLVLDADITSNSEAIRFGFRTE